MLLKGNKETSVAGVEGARGGVLQGGESINGEHGEPVGGHCEDLALSSRSPLESSGQECQKLAYKQMPARFLFTTTLRRGANSIPF